MIRVVRNRKRAEASFQPAIMRAGNVWFDVNVMSGVRLSSAYLPGILERDLPGQMLSRAPSPPAAGVSTSSSTPPG
ncbi:hypothetical protein [Mesorhizobium sp. M0217]|uniref:hypothetical protein n=1 Tax=unclassified Mesorhizobium TaxID=325217 RepID=UPI00333BC171